MTCTCHDTPMKDCPVHAPEESNSFLADHERRLRSLEALVAELRSVYLSGTLAETPSTRLAEGERLYNPEAPKATAEQAPTSGALSRDVTAGRDRRFEPAPPPVEAEGDDAEKIALTFFPTQHVNQAALEARIIQLAIAIRADERRAAVGAFTNAILHGDRDHRDWLIEAHNAFLTHDTLPAPRGKGAAEAERDALRAKLEAAEIECEHLRKLLEAR